MNTYIKKNIIELNYIFANKNVKNQSVLLKNCFLEALDIFFSSIYKISNLFMCN